MESNRVPVTVLTGFLGSGKTTLLNRILTEEHGKRIAVIENEFGEIGIDQALVVNAEEEIFEMNNGCICCTVRGDLIRIIGNLMRRKDKFDHILVETTGLADPSPVAQTFFVDDEMRAQLKLDGIVTVVDARHVWQHIDQSDQCKEQIAFADIILLNKTDLVTPKELDALEQRVRSMNALARVHRTQNAAVEMDWVLEIGGFDLERALAIKPTFLEPEYPFEWGGIYELAAGTYTLALQNGPDPSMTLALFAAEGTDEAALEAAQQEAVPLFSQQAPPVHPKGALVPQAAPVALNLAKAGAKDFFLEIQIAGTYSLFTQHRPEEFDLTVHAADGATRTPRIGRTFKAGHTHDEEVTSVGIEVQGAVDPKKLSAWLSVLLREQGADIFRTKGILHLQGDNRRSVFQGVHMLFDSCADRPWGRDEPRTNQLVFIGRNLDRNRLVREFKACLV
ncbi:CobW family GTP-binding protein [Gloeobacter morelensis]|uniref:GTP-binding protein n=1 Tax=Gloeobacter morelensis MG652769 TaxID=2781736 RepID=A0ABY3PI86_9CYAN|nr:GTP-binding protein [Gloeobacter morelensis]UFP93376.1 GTP-binding protein [Gloeobacter morelensis MG652769]